MNNTKGLGPKPGGQNSELKMDRMKAGGGRSKPSGLVHDNNIPQPKKSPTGKMGNKWMR